MRIGFIWHCPYPWDVRLEKIMKVCIEDGHEVSLLSRWRDPLPESENINGVLVQRVIPPRIFRSKWIAKAVAFPLFFNPFWVAAVARFVRKKRIDVLVVRDLPLAFLAGAAGRMFRVPVILDMAENYPAALRAYQNPLYKPFLFCEAWLPRQYEKASLRLSDHALVVAEEQAQRLQALGVRRLKITLVGNTPEVSSTPVNPPIYSGERTNGSNADILFVGKLDAHRGLELMIRAMPELLQEFPNLTLTVVGSGRERVRLWKLARSLGLGDNVRLPGWVEFRKIWGYIEHSTVCLIPHLRSEHTDTTLPNKLFDYMSLGKPVVASNCAPLERVIRETDCGLTFESGSVSDLQNALRRMLSNPQMRLTKGRNGKRAVQENYNWDIDGKSLRKVIDSMSSRQTL